MMAVQLGQEALQARREPAAELSGTVGPGPVVVIGGHLEY
jgi:hypothetical protein